VSDDELVAHARQGDRAAFGELVERHRAAVYRAARAALGSDAEADDVAQEACLTAYRRLVSFRGDASFKTWLLTITWHQAINRRRSVARWWRRVVPNGASAIENDGGRPSRERSPEQASADRQLREGIRAEIRALSPGLRDALLLAQAGEYYLNPAGAMMAAPITVTGATLEPGAPVVLFPTRIVGSGVDATQGRQYDVASDGRFLINTELDSAAAPITLLMNWHPEAKK
jgi:RNA polymerase sigma-70 factor (ECF subfamily)